MARKNYPLFAREGKRHLLVALAIGVGSVWLWGWGSIPVWLGVLFVVQFFRDPKRTINIDPRAIVSPASGKVVLICEQQNPYEENKLCMKVSVFMNIFSVHSNLIPVAGKIKGCWYSAGKFLNAAMDKSSEENERNAILIETSDGYRITAVQIAGLIARRILCYVNEGNEVEAGERYGFIRFGSRVDLYLPLDCRLDIKLGQWVNSGSSTIGYLPLC